MASAIENKGASFIIIGEHHTQYVHGAGQTVWALAFRSWEMAFRMFLPHTKHHTCWFFFYFPGASMVVYVLPPSQCFVTDSPVNMVSSLPEHVTQKRSRLWVYCLLRHTLFFFFPIQDNKDRRLPSCFLLYCITPPGTGKGNLLSWDDGKIEAMCVRVSSIEWRNELHMAFLVAFRALGTS